MTIEKLTRDNFALSSLDGFVRTQPVTEVYRKFGGEYRLVNEPFTDDWSPARKREKAAEILSGAYTVYRVARRPAGRVRHARERAEQKPPDRG